MTIHLNARGTWFDSIGRNAPGAFWGGVKVAVTRGKVTAEVEGTPLSADFLSGMGIDHSESGKTAPQADVCAPFVEIRAGS